MGRKNWQHNGGYHSRGRGRGNHYWQDASYLNRRHQPYPMAHYQNRRYSHSYRRPNELNATEAEKNEKTIEEKRKATDLVKSKLLALTKEDKLSMKELLEKKSNNPNETQTSELESKRIAHVPKPKTHTVSVAPEPPGINDNLMEDMEGDSPSKIQIGGHNENKFARINMPVSYLKKMASCPTSAKDNDFLKPLLKETQICVTSEMRKLAENKIGNADLHKMLPEPDRLINPDAAIDFGHMSEESLRAFQDFLPLDFDTSLMRAPEPEDDQSTWPTEDNKLFVQSRINSFCWNAEPKTFLPSQDIKDFSFHSISSVTNSSCPSSQGTDHQIPNFSTSCLSAQMSTFPQIPPHNSTIDERIHIETPNITTSLFQQPLPVSLSNTTPPEVIPRPISTVSSNFPPQSSVLPLPVPNLTATTRTPLLFAPPSNFLECVQQPATKRLASLSQPLRQPLSFSSPANLSLPPPAPNFILESTCKDPPLIPTFSHNRAPLETIKIATPISPTCVDFHEMSPQVNWNTSLEEKRQEASAPHLTLESTCKDPPLIPTFSLSQVTPETIKIEATPISPTCVDFHETSSQVNWNTTIKEERQEASAPAISLTLDSSLGWSLNSPGFRPTTHQRVNTSFSANKAIESESYPKTDELASVSTNSASEGLRIEPLPPTTTHGNTAKLISKSSLSTKNYETSKSKIIERRNSNSQQRNAPVPKKSDATTQYLPSTASEQASQTDSKAYVSCQINTDAITMVSHSTNTDIVMKTSDVSNAPTTSERSVQNVPMMSHRGQQVNLSFFTRESSSQTEIKVPEIKKVKLTEPKAKTRSLQQELELFRLDLLALGRGSEVRETLVKSMDSILSSICSIHRLFPDVNPNAITEVNIANNLLMDKNVKKSPNLSKETINGNNRAKRKTSKGAMDESTGIKVKCVEKYYEKSMNCSEENSRETSIENVTTNDDANAKKMTTGYEKTNPACKKKFHQTNEIDISTNKKMKFSNLEEKTEHINRNHKLRKTLTQANSAFDVEPNTAGVESALSQEKINGQIAVDVVKELTRVNTEKSISVVTDFRIHIEDSGNKSVENCESAATLNDLQLDNTSKSEKRNVRDENLIKEPVSFKIVKPLAEAFVAESSELDRESLRVKLKVVKAEESIKKSKEKRTIVGQNLTASCSFDYHAKKMPRSFVKLNRMDVEPWLRTFHNVGNDEEIQIKSEPIDLAQNSRDISGETLGQLRTELKSNSSLDNASFTCKPGINDHHNSLEKMSLDEPTSDSSNVDSEISSYSKVPKKLTAPTEFIGHIGDVLFMKVAGNYLLAGGVDRDVNCFELRRGKQKSKRVYKGHAKAITCLATSDTSIPLETRLFTASKDCIVRSFSVKDASLLASSEHLCGCPLVMVTDEKFVFVGLDSGIIHKLRQTNLKVCKKYNTGSVAIACIAVGVVNGTQVIVSASADKKILLQDSRTGLLRQELNLHVDCSVVSLQLLEAKLYCATSTSKLVIFNLENSERNDKPDAVITMNDPIVDLYVTKNYTICGSQSGEFTLVDNKCKVALESFFNKPGGLLCFCISKNKMVVSSYAGGEVTSWPLPRQIQKVLQDW